MSLRRMIVALVWGAVAVSLASAQQTGPWKFAWNTSASSDGYVPVSAATRYSNERGYGFEGDGTTFFSLRLPEGNYRVTVTTGDGEKSTETTVRAELRRLMLEAVPAAPGDFKRSVFTVNVRQPAIAGGGEVRLKDRERTSEWRSWDDRLTLEFSGSRPAVASFEVERVNVLPTLFIIGDSTVCDQPVEPYASWGQMLTRFFQPTIVLANHAESGESYRSAIGAKRFDKVFSQMEPGDYLIMQFGHNDMKAVDEASYATSIREVVAACRAKGGTPIVVSPLERCGFDDSGRVRESLRGFPDAARDTARELDVAFIDLHAMSKVLYESLGPKRAELAFALVDGRRDLTHHNNYGAYELAKCVALGIREHVPELARHLNREVTEFDAARPDPIDSFALPASGRFPDDVSGR